MNIKDKVVIVTGASAGIGLETAKLLSEQGAKIVLAARSEDIIKKLEKELPNSLAVVTDMTVPESIQAMIDTTIKKYGRIDILINNAGQGMYGSVETIDLQNYQKIINLNIFGPLIAMQKVIPIMRKQGGGMIINISSQVSKNYFPFLGGYASTKYALNALTLTARQELEKDKIIVSLVHPGLTETDFGKNALKTPEAEAQRMESRNRPAMPQADSPRHVAGKILEAINSEIPEQYMHTS